MRLEGYSCSQDAVDCGSVYLDDDKEEFYGSSAPSEDIWNKFELETPPRSPIGLPACDDEWSFSHEKYVDANLKSKLIQDCMWSGLGECATVGGAGKQDRGRNDSFEKPFSPPPPVAAVAAAPAAGECVDPAAVFPYPLNREHSYSMMTPAPSDSEDEIDVVGLENTRLRISASRRPAPGATVVLAGYHAAAKMSDSAASVAGDVNHNLSVVAERLLCQKRPLKMISGSTAVQPCKRSRKSPHSPISSGGCSHASSDSEDFDGKRSMHNVLERKRRNDLKSSFFLLRDHVPELKHQERAAKVVILAKATEYARRLRHEEGSLLAELSAEKQKQARLLEQLERMRN